ncbi:GNAT family N-acetyltransferase [Brachybacterium sp. EE-P12]|uniref:GNAT family N-acetyltransferase n=1 Tax=Brachybacterium sp. EE-P12 TaxID=2306299 RepID=UPI000F0798CB|nr:GNAT family N-acetyltransferase [Brachybacterium sp. EE-P12]
MPDQPAVPPDLHRAVLDDVPVRTLYLLMKLRQDVFTMEQGATDADLDGRELEAGTELLWIQEAGEPIAHLRLLREADGTVRIGRVAVRADRRRGGHGRRLMVAALERARELTPSAEVHLDAQAYLETWYASMGFETVGGMFLEAGIEHVAMVLRPDGTR